jgi:hypothetical protein
MVTLGTWRYYVFDVMANSSAKRAFRIAHSSFSRVLENECFMNIRHGELEGFQESGAMATKHAKVKHNKVCLTGFFDERRFISAGCRPS